MAQRITADLIVNSRAFYNPLKERQLDLRGYKLIVIENLGAMEDQFDTLDLSDNEIKKLDNFPRMYRLRTVLLTNNHITRIDPKVGKNLVHLEHLILTNNRIANLSDLDALAGFPALSTLSLVDNVVTRRQNYRAYVIHKVPQLKALDFRKIKPKERAAAKELFASEAGKKIITAVSAAGQETKKVIQAGPSEEEKAAFAAAIQAATTPEEFDKLERMGRAGVYDLKVLRAMAGASAGAAGSAAK